MNSQPEEDLQRRLQKLEAEINSSSQVEQKQKPESGFVKLNSYLEQWRNWFNSLSKIKKLVFVGATVLLVFAVVQAVFKLVASVISLALLALLVYVGYKFFISGNFQRKQ